MNSYEHLKTAFNQVYLINLKRRNDRMEQFNALVKTNGWPFQEPTYFAAIDGHKLPLPDGWTQGHGAYGCMESHRAILRDAILKEHQTVLICEDDLVWRPTFAAEVDRFMRDVPADWEMLFIGGQHLANCAPIDLGNGIARSTGTNRYHCYAVRGPMIKDLYQKLISRAGHCDLVIWPDFKARKIYCPHPTFIAGQGKGWSDISNQTLVTRYWSEAPKDAPVIYLRAPREVAEAAFKKGFHPGFNRDGATGVDVWLKGLLEKGEPQTVLANNIRGFVNGIRGEATGQDFSGVAVLWAPAMTYEVARLALKGIPTIDIEASTWEEFEKQWADRIKAMPALKKVA